MRETRDFFHVVRLSDVERGRENNLNLIRFGLASLVIFSHSYVLRGLYGAEPMHAFFGYSDLGTIAVYSFFFVSGYLILKSALNWSSPDQYILARGLRIFPALVTAVLLSAFVLGPVMTTLPVGEYFSSRGTWAYLADMVLHRTQDPLPGVFKGNSYPDVVNGVLWTLPVEWAMYMVTLVLCLAFRWRASFSRFERHTWLILGGGLLLTVQMLPLPHPYWVLWTAFFFAGSVCYLAREKVLLSLPAAVVLLGCDLLLLRSRFPHAGRRMMPVALCYFLITFGYHPAVRIRSFNRIGDYSYGLYIYAWPIQQAMVSHFSGPLSFFAGTYPLVLCVAILSWWLIEKPSLSLKKEVRREMSLPGAKAA